MASNEPSERDTGITYVAQSGRRISRIPAAADNGKMDSLSQFHPVEMQSRTFIAIS
jgi:hypothetical protein